MEDEGFATPEEAATAAVSGETVDVDDRPDGRWSVVIKRSGGALWFVVCTREDGGWVVEDEGEMSPSEGSSRSVWISLLDDGDVDGLNVGVEVAWGTAPPGVRRGVVTAGSQRFGVRVDDGQWWLVRWEVPDSDESDDWDADVIGFATTHARGGG